jgi:hypothetical protein
MAIARRRLRPVEFADGLGRHERPRGLRRHVRRAAYAFWFAAVAAACTSGPSPSPSRDPAAVLFIEPGEKVQTGPPTEELKVVMSNLQVLAENHGDDLGYPWFDATTGELVLSVVTPRGRELIDGAGITAPYRIRSVAHGTAELRRIQDDATFLRAQGVPGAELIYSTVPDWRDNRALIVISAASQPLLDALTARYPADALAVQVKPPGAP